MGGTFAKSGYLDQFEAEGYAVLRRVFTAAEVAEMAAAFDRIWARALAGGRSWRDRNVFFCVAEEPGNGPVLRFAQWTQCTAPGLDRVRRDPPPLDIPSPMPGADLKQTNTQPN